METTYLKLGNRQFFDEIADAVVRSWNYKLDSGARPFNGRKLR